MGRDLKGDILKRVDEIGQTIQADYRQQLIVRKVVSCHVPLVSKGTRVDRLLSSADSLTAFFSYQQFEAGRQADLEVENPTWEVWAVMPRWALQVALAS